jgi:hypothetical protein
VVQQDIVRYSDARTKYEYIDHFVDFLAPPNLFFLLHLAFRPRNTGSGVALSSISATMIVPQAGGANKRKLGSDKFTVTATGVDQSLAYIPWELMHSSLVNRCVLVDALS